MQSVITHPGGVAEGVDSPAARQHLPVTLGELDQVIAPSRALDSATRLEIYVDAYFERLLECLREEFLATAHLLGDDLFHGVAFGYLQQYPSRSYTLNQLGALFPKFLGESRLHAHGAPDGAPAGWADFVIELAAFERSQREVFDGPGIERQGATDLTALRDCSPEQWQQLRLMLAPCLRLHRFEFAVDAYWTSVRQEQTPPAIVPEPVLLAIHRREYTIERHRLNGPQFQLLAELAAGRSLAEAMVRTAERYATDAPGWEQYLGAWFQFWGSRGFFSGARLD